jgi:hypothetical protein
MGIEPDYYLALAPDPPENELLDIRRRLSKIRKRKGWKPRD